MVDDTVITTRIRQLEASRKQRASVHAAQLVVDELAPLPPGVVAVDSAALSGLTQAIRELVAIEKQQLELLEQNFGKLGDQNIWLPFSVSLAAGTNVVVQAVVDSDTVLYFQGWGLSHVDGCSYEEILDAETQGEIFAPPSSESITSEQYGTKGRRIVDRVSIVINNATGVQQTFNGYFRGRFRIGGR